MTGEFLDCVTLLESKGPLATKRITRSNGGPVDFQGYGKARRFSIEETPVANIDELAAVLEASGPRPRVFVVRGRPAEGIDRNDTVRRLHPRKRADGTVEPPTLAAARHHWLLLDVDSLECPTWLDPLEDPDHTVEYAVSRLPPEFHGATVWWQFTAGQQLKPGIRIRLGFWLDQALDDASLKRWLADAPVDPAIFAPAQPIYVAHPVFVGMPDPVLRRSGTWRGDRDAVTPPIIEKPKARPHNSSSDAADPSGGGGYEFHCGQIGDHDGGAGFFRPLKSAVASWIAQHGATADTTWLREDLERIIRAARRDPAKHDDRYVETRVADLDPLIAAILDLEAAKAVVEPTYAPQRQGDTLDEARAKLALEARRFAETSLAHIENTASSAAEAEARGDAETWKEPAPPVCGVKADIGLGKTRVWREEIAAKFVERGLHPVLAVPRHRLGDEIVRDFAEAGIVARDFRGREYPDPEQPGKAMCHDLERIKAIEEAGGDISRQACRSKKSQCAFYDLCGYQKQRRARPDVWLMPHQMLTRPKPAFVKCGALGIDEAFWSVLLHGTERRVTLELSALIIGDRSVPKDPANTADLIEISRSVYNIVMAEPDGRLRRAEVTQALHSARVSLDDLRLAYRLEWSRKISLDELVPGMPAAAVKELCGRAAAHNPKVTRLARFWRLLADTVAGNAVRSPWLDLQHEAKTSKDTVEPAVHLAWCDDVHESWRGVPTMIMDATMPTEIVRRFYPDMAEPVQITAPTPHVHVRQITDKPMSKNRLIPTGPSTGSGQADTRENRTRRANAERVRRFIEVRAFEASGGKVAVICNQGLETLLKAGALSGNVAVDHFNNITGENRFADVAVLILIGRPEAPPRAAELMARVLFETDIDEIASDAGGRTNYPPVTRGLRLRDGTGVAVKGPQHPDPRVEDVRWAICESELLQTAGRGRGVNRTGVHPLQLDILTNVALPIVVDEATTWERIQPTLAQVMRARGAVPLFYADMAACYPDLFASAGAAEQALRRQNPLQTPIEIYFIGVCRGFSLIGYRRRGSRGPTGRLLYDPARIDPAAWLTKRLGDVTVLPGAEPAPTPPPAADAAPARRVPSPGPMPRFCRLSLLTPLSVGAVVLHVAPRPYRPGMHASGTCWGSLTGRNSAAAE